MGANVSSRKSIYVLSDMELANNIRRSKLEKAYRKEILCLGDATSLKKKQNLVDSTEDLVSHLSAASSKREIEREELDLSAFSTKDLKDQIDRRKLEKQYIDLFSEPKAKELKKIKMEKFLARTKEVLIVTSLVLGITISIKQLISV